MCAPKRVSFLFELFGAGPQPCDFILYLYVDLFEFMFILFLVLFLVREFEYMRAKVRVFQQILRLHHTADSFLSTPSSHSI